MNISLVDLDLISLLKVLVYCENLTYSWVEMVKSIATVLVSYVEVDSAHINFIVILI